MKKTVLILLFIVTNIFGQEPYPIDTSYTVKSTYAKLIRNYPDIKIPKKSTSKNVQEKFNIIYKNENARALHLDAFFNTTRNNNPAILLIHGGGWRSGNKALMHILAQKIAKEGYSCFAIEYRLSLEAKYPEGIYDIKNAIQFVKENASKYHVDANKIVVLGCSAGGQMAALVGTTNNNATFEKKSISKQNTNVAAIVNIDGILAFKHPESQEGEMAAFWLGGTYEENPQNWENASALSHVSQNTPPMLFINSSFKRFHAGRDDVIKVLNQFNIYSEVHSLPNSPHSFWLFEPWLEQTVTHTTRFLNKIFK
ncbi:alpha/beta hydrolase fold domain-containing protein [Flavobacterium faecale]|uniref:alpha/beta hydrolase fold domain-containing protein n=1 Tax=Flavobacterium faecale TaxID=1355330 RepID=UPI003AB1073F